MVSFGIEMTLFPSVSKLKRSYAIRFIYWAAVLNFLDLAARIFSGRKHRSARKAVVFVKMDGIGDFVIWTASFDAIQEIFPHDKYERILIGNARWKSLAQKATLFDRQIFIDPDRFVFSPTYRFAELRKISRSEADIVINPRLTRDFLWGDSIVRSLRAPVKVGSEGLDNLMTRFQERISAKWYTELLPPPAPDEHEILSNRNFLAGIAKNRTAPLRAPDIQYLPTGKKFDLPDRYAVLFLSAQSPDRRWPPRKFAEAGRHLSVQHGLPIVLCGGPNDHHLVAEFRASYSGDAISLLGQTSLPDLVTVLKDARIILTNDTGAGHLALAAGCPAVVVLPGNQVGRYFPYPKTEGVRFTKHIPVMHQMECFGCGYNCIFRNLPKDAPKPCVADVAVDDVVRAIDRLLAETSDEPATSDPGPYETA